MYLLAILVMAGGIFALIQMGLASFPSEENPGELQGFPYLLGLMGVAAVVALLAWPRLTLALMAYGYLARLPVVLVTHLDLDRGWDTHYGELPPGVPPTGPTETFWALVTPQLTLWPLVFTPVVGGLCGCLGAALGRRK